MITHDLVIIGGGSAGMAAAISAYDNGVKDILILEKNEFLGGILNQCIHDGFGLHEFKEALTGPEFLTRFVKQVEERKIEYKLDTFVTDITLDKKVSYVNKKDGAVTIQAKAIIGAMGCYERSAGAIGLPGDRPSGVVTAGQAQLYLNEKGYLVGKKFFILGSGDIGLIMARRLTLEGAKVVGVAELMPYSNGLNRNIVQCLNDYNIPLYLSHTVSKVIGKGKLEKIEISKVDDKLQPIPGTEKEFEVDTLLLSVGLVPYNALFAQCGITPGPTKGSKVNEHYETSCDGVFSCGNVLHVHDLVDLVVDEARGAGKAAALYLNGKLERHSDLINCSAGNGIGYVIPSTVDLENVEDKITFKFRVRKPVKNVELVFCLNGKELRRMIKPVLIPSEMQTVSLDKSLFNDKNGELCVSLEERKAA